MPREETIVGFRQDLGRISRHGLWVSQDREQARSVDILGTGKLESIEENCALQEPKASRKPQLFAGVGTLLELFSG